MRLLVIEDEPTLRKQIVECLKQEKYAVDQASDGEEGHYLGDVEQYDAIILDLGLPRLDGLTVLKRWRSDGRTHPVIILTARDRWNEKVSAIDAGADDYITKPFKMEELLARLRAVIRRSGGHSSSTIGCGELELNTQSGKCTVGGRAIRLTAQEFRILSYFLHHQDKIISRTEIIDHIYDQDFDLDSNIIEVFIGRLRKKLGGDYIKTQRGLGYTMPKPEPNSMPKATPNKPAPKATSKPASKPASKPKASKLTE